jgi:hypothetical protein
VPARLTVFGENPGTETPPNSAKRNKMGKHPNTM